MAVKSMEAVDIRTWIIFVKPYHFKQGEKGQLQIIHFFSQKMFSNERTGDRIIQ